MGEATDNLTASRREARLRRGNRAAEGPSRSSPRGELIIALGWAIAAIAARAPFVARIEGVLDHDQSVVGLMALDIAAGRRFPIFFDGQRYMGAIEPYLAAVFVRVLGHSPTVVALAPLLAFGAFVAGQYFVWSRWQGRATGHLAAAFAAVGSPMLALWGVVPRGGYIECLAWALPTLWAYRAVARRDAPELPPLLQAAWGFWFAVGYFINPIALVLYVTLALDWIFGRHGADLRRDRGLTRNTPWWVGPIAGLAFIIVLAAFCHVDPHVHGGSLYVAFCGLSRASWALGMGAAGVVVLLGAAAWWSRGPARLFALVSKRPWAVAGVLLAWSPFVAHAIGVKLGLYPEVPSLPIWIAAPWKVSPSARTAFKGLGTLVGCDPRSPETVLIGQGVLAPEPRWPVVADALVGLSPIVAAVALILIVAALRRERSFWSGLCTLRRDEVASGPGLAGIFLGVSIFLYLLQGTSPNASSVRYLLPVWVALPGLLACGVHSLPRRHRPAFVLGLIVPWTAAHLLVALDLKRPSPALPLAEALAKRGVTAIVAPTPVALVVANLSHGKVGALEYLPIWPRLGARYVNRFSPNRPIICVTDRQFRSQGPTGADLAHHLQQLAAQRPGRVRLACEVGPFEVWEVDPPLEDIFAPAPDATP
jgi:hypothetical protein